MTEKQRRGAKAKPAGQKVLPVTRYVSEINIIKLGGIVKVRMMVDDYLKTEINKLQ